MKTEKHYFCNSQTQSCCSMRIKLLFAFLLCSLFAKAQTIEVSGPQSGRWEADTILITNNVVVQDSLSIMPGTTVLFDGFFNITVGNNAMLNALGTQNDSILFTVADTTGFSIFNSGRGGWNGILLGKGGALQVRLLPLPIRQGGFG